VLSELRHELSLRARHALRRTGALLRSRAAAEGRFRASYFADRPVDLDRMTDYKLENFPESGPLPWLDETDAEARIDQKLRSGELSALEAEQCRSWTRRGFAVLEGFFEPGRLDRIWEAYEEAVRNGRLALQPEPNRNPADPHPSRSLDSHLIVPQVATLLRDEGLCRWVRLFFGREPIPYQTLVAHKGSEQREHSDTIHMTTYPVGYLAAAWVAFEDIHPDCGPVVYYPGSHRLPCLSSLALGISTSDFRLRGYEGYNQRYEPAIQKLIEEKGLAREAFLPRKGDVLLWHANLIHAGSPRRDIRLSRKSAVLHYFASGAVCYHDLSGALVPMERLR
jgi:Phytanoyl-CoA dioxygenase (PhyH)